MKSKKETISAILNIFRDSFIYIYINKVYKFYFTIYFTSFKYQDFISYFISLYSFQ